MPAPDRDAFRMGAELTYDEMFDMATKELKTGVPVEALHAVTEEFGRERTEEHPDFGRAMHALRHRAVDDAAEAFKSRATTIAAAVNAWPHAAHGE
jgi:hypothetical protein